MTVADHLLAGLLTLVCGAQLLLRIDPAAHSRATLYRAALVSGFLFGLAPLLVWAAAGRPLRDFGLAGWLGDPGRLLAFALPWALLLALAGRLAVRAPLRRPLAGLYRRLDYLMPRTRRELRTSWIVSAVAGCGEEIAFRGFLLWYGVLLLGPAGGLAASSLLFAAAHGYQGRLGMIFAALAGLLLGLAYLASASLVLAMGLHATYNMASFALGRRLLAGEVEAAPL